MALLLAAGESSRMGSPKPLLRWGKGTLIEYQIEEFSASRVEKVIVVLGYRAEEIEATIADAEVQIVVNEDYRLGRATSIKAGAHAVPDEARVIVAISVDQPRPRTVIDALSEAHLNNNLITLPTYGGRNGHPPVFSGSLLNELRNVSEERQGLREIMQRHASEITKLPWDSDVVLLDMNTPEEYQRALARYPFE